MQPRGPLRGVGKTALGVAMIRARESRRDDRLFDDPYAQAFVNAAPGAFPDEPKTERQVAALGPLASLGAVFHLHGVIRTRFYDDYLTAATAAGCRQVVLLAAGLDTRALRLAWPPRTRVFELDLPDVLAFKDTVLAASSAVSRCERVTVPADLREDWTATLTEAGFDVTSPTAWLAEGLLLYLTADEAGRLLTNVSDLSAPGSQLSFEHTPMAAASLTATTRQMPTMQQYTALWKGGLGADAPGWLSGHSWQPQFHELAALAAYYCRPIPDATHGGFLTALRVTP
ncbi:MULTISPECIES: SAM-dependent methyltransferase [unclassified Frankia]|uniref:SAM-dependent methyltransferase n=1 Tax=unclassified Frankia TaxID=2632575 RepID=UPI002AD244C2|nr:MULTISPECIES: SAM-dependent methyltransferase [unclassified Frankia]